MEKLWDTSFNYKKMENLFHQNFYCLVKEKNPM